MGEEGTGVQTFIRAYKQHRLQHQKHQNFNNELLTGVGWKRTGADVNSCFSFTKALSAPGDEQNTTLEDVSLV